MYTKRLLTVTDEEDCANYSLIFQKLRGQLQKCAIVGIGWKKTEMEMSVKNKMFSKQP